MLNKLKSFKPSALQRNSDSSNDSQYLVALDIGTEYVKALIAQIDNESINIVGEGRAHQGLSDMQAGAIANIAAVVRNCDEALNMAEQQAGVSVRTVVIGIAGELVKGTTNTVRCTRKNSSKPLDLEELDQIITLVQQRAEAKARQQLAWELGGKSVEIKLVNSAIVGIEIDGYTVTNPVGFQGKDVVVQLYTAFAPLVHIGALERTAQELDLDLLAVAAEPFAVSRSVIGDKENTTMSAVLMDIGGGTTDIAVINDGGVQGTKMFGIGGRAFTKSVERAMDIEFSQAEDLKLAVGSNKIPAHKSALIEDALKKTLGVWTSGVELALSEFDQLDSLPNQILLCGGGSSLEMLVSKLQNDNWYKKLPFTKKPTIKHIETQQVVGIIDKTGQVNDHTFITAMGLLRVGMDTLAQASDGPKGSIKQRIDRMLRV